MASAVKKERCPGTGSFARDRAGNPSGSCLVCGHFGRLTKTGCLRTHKRAVPPAVRTPKHPKNARLAAISDNEVVQLARILRVHYAGFMTGLDQLGLAKLFENERQARKLKD